MAHRQRAGPPRRCSLDQIAGTPQAGELRSFGVKKFVLLLSSRSELWTEAASPHFSAPLDLQVLIADQRSMSFCFCQENVEKFESRRAERCEANRRVSVAPSPIRSHFNALTQRRPPKSAACPFLRLRPEQLLLGHVDQIAKVRPPNHSGRLGGAGNQIREQDAFSHIMSIDGLATGAI